MFCILTSFSGIRIFFQRFFLFLHHDFDPRELGLALERSE